MTPEEQIQHLQAECDRLTALVAELYKEIDRLRERESFEDTAIG